MQKRALIVGGVALGAALLFAARRARADDDESIDVQDAPLLESLSDSFTSFFVDPASVENTVSEALDNTNVQAFLRMIRYAEGTAGADGYRTLFGGALFDSFADHPHTVITAMLGGKEIKSSAAGAYQFLTKTWYGAPPFGHDRVQGMRYANGVAAAIEAADFSPYWQDRAAVYLIKRRGALDDVLNGRFFDAIEKCRQEWASLPGAGYGQPEKSRDVLAQVFEENGGVIV